MRSFSKQRSRPRRPLTRFPLRGAGAFTLIELLIVVAIIAILAAIAVPNFLEAQTRARVGRAHADMRSMATAAEAYCVDHGMYPLNGVLNMNGTMQNPHHTPQGPPYHKFLFEGITTPIAYMTSIPNDPFMDTATPPEAGWAPWYRRYFYTNLPWFQELMGPNPPPVIAVQIAHYGDWVLASAGPNRRRRDLGQYIYYDPTNGTISDGDIVRSPRLMR